MKLNQIKNKIKFFKPCFNITEKLKKYLIKKLIP